MIRIKEKNIHSLPRLLKNSTVLVVTSPGWVRRGGMKKIQRLLKKKVVFVYSRVRPNPSLHDLLKLKNIFLTKKFDVWLGIGGGSVIDTTKALAYLNSIQFSRRIFLKSLHGRTTCRNHQKNKTDHGHSHHRGHRIRGDAVGHSLGFREEKEIFVIRSSFKTNLARIGSLPHVFPFL